MSITDKESRGAHVRKLLIHSAYIFDDPVELRHAFWNTGLTNLIYNVFYSTKRRLGRQENIKFDDRWSAQFLAFISCVTKWALSCWTTGELVWNQSKHFARTEAERGMIYH